MILYVSWFLFATVFWRVLHTLPCFAGMLQVWRHFCENLRIFMKSIEWDRGSGAKHSPPGWGSGCPKGGIPSLTTFLSIVFVLGTLSMTYCWHNHSAGTPWAPERPVMCGALFFSSHCHHYFRYGGDIIVSPPCHFGRDLEIRIKMFEWHPRSVRIAFSVRFHGYTRLQNLIRIFFTKHDVRNQFSWFFWWCAFLIVISESHK